MKKVFSVEKFRVVQSKFGISEKEIEISVNSWAKKCEGLTRQEMYKKHRYITIPEWMVEVMAAEERLLELQKRGYAICIWCLPEEANGSPTYEAEAYKIPKGCTFSNNSKDALFTLGEAINTVEKTVAKSEEETNHEVC